jgi:hypothetical protein
MASAPNGDVYAYVSNVDIYKQTGGIGNFIALSQTSRDWRGMTSAPNGDVYACVLNGDIYKDKELTLKIDDTEPCLIYDEAGNLVTSFNPLYFPAGCVVEFTYDGTSYRFKNKVIESYVNGTDCYRVFTNGWIEQGGRVAAGSWPSSTVNLFKQYRNINYSICHAEFHSSVYDDTGVIISTGSRTVSSFVFLKQVGFTGGLFWETKGF